MASLLTRAGCFVAIILLGYLLRRVGYFKEEDFSLLGKVFLRITLPAAIITGFAGRTIDVSMLLIAALGFGLCVLYMVVAYLVNLRNSRQQQAFDVLNLTGFNVCALTMPFLQSFLGSYSVVVASLFDMGNAAIGLGTSYGIAASIQDGKGFSFKRIGKALSTSVVLMTHILMTILALAGVSLPGPVLDLAELVGSGNTFLAMLMIGVGLRLPSDGKQLGKLLRLVQLRYSVGALMAMLFWRFLPFDRVVRLTLVMLALSPVITAAPAYTGELKGDVGLSSAFNSLCIVLSIVIYTVLLSIML